MDATFPAIRTHSFLGYKLPAPDPGSQPQFKIYTQPAPAHDGILSANGPNFPVIPWHCAVCAATAKFFHCYPSHVATACEFSGTSGQSSATSCRRGRPCIKTRRASHQDSLAAPQRLQLNLFGQYTRRIPSQHLASTLNSHPFYQTCADNRPGSWACIFHGRKILYFARASKGAPF